VGNPEVKNWKSAPEGHPTPYLPPTVYSKIVMTGEFGWRAFAQGLGKVDASRSRFEALMTYRRGEEEKLAKYKGGAQKKVFTRKIQLSPSI